MPRKKIGNDFSPTLHLLNIMIKVIKVSVPTTARFVNCDTLKICNRSRSQINLCIDVTDGLAMLAVCNSNDGCARTTIIYPQKGINAFVMAENIHACLKKSGLGGQINLGLEGLCAKSLEAAKIATSQETTNDPRSPIQGGRCRMEKTTTDPIPITGKSDGYIPVTTSIIQRIAKNVSGIREVERIGTSGLCENAQDIKKHQICLKVIEGILTLAFCHHKQRRSYLFKIHHQKGVDPHKLLNDILTYLSNGASDVTLNNAVEISCVPNNRQAANQMAKAAQAETEEDGWKIYSRRFPKPIDWNDQPEVEEVYQALLILRGSQRVNMEDGTFILKSPVQLLTEIGRRTDRGDLWWQDGWTKLCNIVPRIVEPAPKDKGMRIHHVQLASNCLASITTPKKEEEPQMNTSDPAKLSPRSLQLFQVLVTIAGGVTGKTVKVEGYAPKLKAALPNDFPPTSIPSLITALKKLKLVQSAGRGNISVKCVASVAKDATATASSQAADDPGNSESEETSATPTVNPPRRDPSREELESMVIRGPTPDELTTATLIALLGGNFDDELELTELVDDLLGTKSASGLRTIYRLLKLGEYIKDQTDCPQFDDTGDKVKVITTL